MPDHHCDVTGYGRHAPYSSPEALSDLGGSDAGSSQLPLRRGAACEPQIDPSEQSAANSTPTPRRTRAAATAGSAAVAAPAAALSRPAMAERAAKLFPLDAAGPAASGMGLLASSPVNALVLFAFEAANKRCEAHGSALSLAYGNFDRVVATGWLVADALGLPLLERGDAFRLGGAARKRAAKVEKTVAAKNKAAATAAAKAADGEARQLVLEAAAKEHAELLAAPVEPPLELPAMPPETAARTVAVGGKRKRDVISPERDVMSCAKRAQLAHAAVAKAAKLERAAEAEAKAAGVHFHTVLASAKERDGVLSRMCEEQRNAGDAAAAAFDRRIARLEAESTEDDAAVDAALEAIDAAHSEWREKEHARVQAEAVAHAAHAEEMQRAEQARIEQWDARVQEWDARLQALQAEAPADGSPADGPPAEAQPVAVDGEEAGDDGLDDDDEELRQLSWGQLYTVAQEARERNRVLLAWGREMRDRMFALDAALMQAAERLGPVGEANYRDASDEQKAQLWARVCTLWSALDD